MRDGSFKRYGCMYEIFEDCIYDIDLAIKVAKEKGYKRIILLGHSYGCNKVIYYFYKKHPSILGIILASAPDMIGSHMLVQSNDYDELIKEAKDNIDNNEPTKLLHKMFEDYMYMSSQTYYNWFKKDSNLDNLPIIRGNNNWKQLESINVPILTFSGSCEEDYYLHLDLLKDKAINCNNFEYKIIEDTSHTYNKKEEEIAKLIFEWIDKNF
jgi:alpha-beta hydrolase superfamily lysophospholipase